MEPKTGSVVHSDPEILGGMPVFVGTRVSFGSLIDYLVGGHSLDEFLDDFPSVTRVQAVAALEAAEEALLHRVLGADLSAAPAHMAGGLLPPDVDPAPFDLSEEQLREIQRRLAEHKADPSSAIPLDKVLERIERSLGQGH